MTQVIPKSKKFRSIAAPVVKNNCMGEFVSTEKSHLQSIVRGTYNTVANGCNEGEIVIIKRFEMDTFE